AGVVDGEGARAARGSEVDGGGVEGEDGPLRGLVQGHGVRLVDRAAGGTEGEGVGVEVRRSRRAGRNGLRGEGDGGHRSGGDGGGPGGGGGRARAAGEPVAQVERLGGVVGEGDRLGGGGGAAADLAEVQTRRGGRYH